MTARPRIRANALAYSKLIRALQRGPCTYWDLCGASGLGYDAVKNHVRALRAELCVRIADWKRAANFCPNIPMYELCTPSTCKDASPPTPMTQAQRSAAYRQRRSQKELTKCVTSVSRTPWAMPPTTTPKD
jgi:hypothetical protein